MERNSSEGLNERFFYDAKVKDATREVVSFQSICIKKVQWDYHAGKLI